MSAKNPGIIFDASNSWNGYNHQGRVALYVAIKTICEKWDKTKSISDNAENLKNYFLELEYLEDFSIGIIEDGKEKYISVHQVKDRNDNNLKSYDNALLGLVQHIIEKPEIENLYLHVSTDLRFANKDMLLEHLKELIQNPKFIAEQLSIIEEYRASEDLQDNLLKKKCGRSAEFKKNIFKILKELDIKDGNLEKAFKRYEELLNERKDKFASVTENALKKIGIYKYATVVGAYYCSVDEIHKLILNTIKRFYELLIPEEATYRATDDNFHEKCFLFLYDKLLEHIIERDSYYSYFKQGTKDRKIKFIQIIEWLNSAEIDSHGIEYYLYHAREKILKYMSKFCKSCYESTGCKNECRIEKFRNAFMNMSYDRLKDFIYATNPQENQKLNIDSYTDFVSKYAFSNHYPEGLRDIEKDFIDDKVAVIFKDDDNGEYVLSSIYEDKSNNKKSICTQIVMNENINMAMMDYDGFISYNMDVPSILDATLSPTFTEDGYDSTNITRWKNIKIISLKKFKDKVNK